MGMAASQARLLTLTSRLHDVEYKAQNIESQKVALATQKDELYQNYCDALDAKKIQVAYNNGDGTRSFVDATFSTMCTFNEYRMAQYALTDSKTGKVIVDSHTAEVYENFNTDKYTFAFAMMGMDYDFGWPVDSDDGRFNMGMEVGIGVCTEDYGYGTAQNGSNNLFMTDVEKIVFDNHYNENDKLKKAYDNLTETCNSSETTMTEQRDALENFRDVLYYEYGSEIYKYMRLNKQDSTNTDPDSATAEFNDEFPEEFPQEEFNYYANLFEKIQAAGGCQEIDPQYESGEEGNQWLNNMVSSGRVTIDVYNNKEWLETSVATSTNVNYLQEVQDETDLKKAEAEYEYQLGVINDKDSKYDRDLSKLETERSAITTAMDSIKQVRNDNVERTFGIFS